MKLLSIIFIFHFTCCSSQEIHQNIYSSGKTIEERFITPAGFVREKVTQNSYANFLRKLPLKKSGAQVFLFNGQLKNTQLVHEAVIDYEIGNKDLQQCADAVIRIRAEYLYKTLQFDKIHFNFTNGTKAEFAKYGDGYRYSSKNNTWNKTAKADFSYENFKKFLELVYTYAGSLSLSKELVSVEIEHIQPGDVFIVGGSPGHAVTVIDVLVNPETKLKLFMIAQSYMPAQNIHILKNFNQELISPWYSSNFGNTLKTPEWTFSKYDLKRFKD